MATDSVSFPRQHARTQRFTLGAPRACAVAPHGSHIAYLRSGGGTDRSHILWVLDLTSGREYPAADPAALLGGADEELSPEERARRERSREGSAGIVGYAVDTAVELAAFALSGRLLVSELRAGTARELPTPTPVLDPRPSPDGRHVAYVAQGGLRVVGTDGSGDRALAEPDGEGVTWGLAEFIAAEEAAEEMGRARGFWWSPDSDRLLATRVDGSPVQRWWISDPANPGQEPNPVAYPAAGTANADVTLHLLDTADGARTEVVWDRERFPYLATVHWSAAGPPLLLVQSRDQQDQLYLTVDTDTGRTEVLHAEQSPSDGWLEIHSGVPAWTPDGRLVRISDRSGARVLMAGNRALTDGRLHIRAVLDIGDEDILFSASAGAGAQSREGTEGSDGSEDSEGSPGSGDSENSAASGAEVPGDIGVYRARFAPAEPVAQPSWERVSDGSRPGVRTAVRGGDTVVMSTARLDRPGASLEVVRLGPEGGPHQHLAPVPSYAETPVLTARPRLLHAGKREIPCAVLLPTGYRDGDGPLPVLLDPYGGPHGQRVVAAHNPHLTSQWFADQGFAVIVADGRGTPGRSPAWEQAVSGDFAQVTLEDQIDALHALAGSRPLDLGRVGIRGWSFGGYLAALAVLRRPDVFHAGIAGAPVTDWRLYDTHYTERYLGLPQEKPEAYATSSLIHDGGLSAAAPQHRPLMLIHGLADDNVVTAHTLRLSSALLAAGRPHEVLPLSGVTHMTPQEQIAENLLLLQVDFLKRSLGVA